MESSEIRVQSPAGVLKIEITGADTVLDLREFILEYPEICHFTCFHLFLEGRRLTIFSELSAYPGIFRSRATIRMRPGRYDDGESRLHVTRFRELLTSPPSKLTSRNLFDHSFKVKERQFTRKSRWGVVIKSRTLSDYASELVCDEEALSINRTTEFRYHCILSKFNTSYLNGEWSWPGTINKTMLPECIKSINYAQYNPPPGNRRLRGDILYLKIVTLEKEVLFITAGSDGFFVNKSTDEVFNPAVAEPQSMDSTLVGLLLARSPLFRKRYDLLLRVAGKAHSVSNLPVPFPLSSWTLVSAEHKSDPYRAELFLCDNFGCEVRAPQRDWNEEYQSLNSIPRKTVEDRIVRDRSIFRFYVDFVYAAQKGARAIIEGSIPPLNPMDSQRSFVYVFNQIFFSLAVDARGQYEGVDGDATANKMSGHDIKGLREVQRADIEGIHVLATCLVDYCGQRVVCQALIPGILHGDQNEFLIYGVKGPNGAKAMKRKAVTRVDEEFFKRLKKLAAVLKWASHKIKDSDGKFVELLAAAELKGLAGSDKRKYCLDLIRCFPRDANYPDPKNVHRLLRGELLPKFARDSAFKEFIDEVKKTNGTSIDKSASVFNKENDILKKVQATTFNLNCFTKWKIVGPNSQRDTNRILECSKYLKDVVINQFIKDLVRSYKIPLDSVDLSDCLHSAGINIRYLGYIVDQLPQDSEYWKGFLIREMLVRGGKQVFCSVMMRLSEGGRQSFNEVVQHELLDADKTTIASIVAKFLNSFFGQYCGGVNLTDDAISRGYKMNEQLREQHEKFLESCVSPLTEDPFFNENEPTKRRFHTGDDSDHVFYPANVYAAVFEEIEKKFDYIVEPIIITSRQRLCMLRSLCQRIGVQIATRDYDFGVIRPFSEDDIIDLFPVVKMSVPESGHVDQKLEQGRSKIRDENWADAEELLQKAMALAQCVYGPTHPKSVEIHLLLAITQYHLGDFAEALENQKRATMISERINGLDHYLTAQLFSTLALFSHHVAASSKSDLRGSNKKNDAEEYYLSARLYLNRSIYLHELIAGPNHPATALQIMNMGTLYQQQRRAGDAMTFFSEARKRLCSSLGEGHVRVLQCDDMIGRCYAQELHQAISIRDPELANPNLPNPVQAPTKVFILSETADSIESFEFAYCILKNDCKELLNWNSCFNIPFKILSPFTLTSPRNIPTAVQAPHTPTPATKTSPLLSSPLLTSFLSQQSPSIWKDTDDELSNPSFSPALSSAISSCSLTPHQSPMMKNSRSRKLKKKKQRKASSTLSYRRKKHELKKKVMGARYLAETLIAQAKSESDEPKPKPSEIKNAIMQLKQFEKELKSLKKA